MTKATVVVCEPVERWLVDDGVRLMPTDIDEWLEVHRTFCQLLDISGISYKVLPSSLMDLSARTELVLRFWRAGNDNEG
jgi:hypothetical protein